MAISNEKTNQSLNMNVDVDDCSGSGKLPRSILGQLGVELVGLWRVTNLFVYFDCCGIMFIIDADVHHHIIIPQPRFLHGKLF